MNEQLLPTCVCGSIAAVQDKIHRIPVLVCQACGIVRQSVEMDRAQLSAWYRERYFQGGVYQHTYDHDCEVAELRLRAYHLPAGIKLLDVGAGNGAFVDTARGLGLDAWGQDPSTAAVENEHLYTGASLKDVAFPTDDFDVVTLHDVLEHEPDLMLLLAEIRRVLKPGGKLIVDFPRFFHENGKHHWKPTEHLWFLDVEQLMHVLKQAGFSVNGWSFPIPSKVVVECEHPEEKRVSILTPAGIGDTYWVLVKLPGFLQARGIYSIPDVYVQEMGPKRTVPYLRAVNFVHSAGYKPASPDRIFHEAYMQDGRRVFENVLGVDYFIAYNGALRHGRDLLTTDPEYGCAWRPKLHVSKEAQAFRAKLEADGPYAACFFTMSGMYMHWLSEFGPEHVWESCIALQKRLGLRIVLIGAQWDRGQIGDTMGQRAAGHEGWLNLVGQTSFDQLLGTILGASLVYGWPAGNTMLGPPLGVPTALIWNRYFQRGMWTNCMPPDSPYVALDTAGLSVDGVVAAARKVMAR